MQTIFALWFAIGNACVVKAWCTGTGQWYWGHLVSAAGTASLLCILNSHWPSAELLRSQKPTNGVICFFCVLCHGVGRFLRQLGQLILCCHIYSLIPIFSLLLSSFLYLLACFSLHFIFQHTFSADSVGLFIFAVRGSADFNSMNFWWKNQTWACCSKRNCINFLWGEPSSTKLDSL